MNGCSLSTLTGVQAIGAAGIMTGHIQMLGKPMQGFILRGGFSETPGIDNAGDIVGYFRAAGTPALRQRQVRWWMPFRDPSDAVYRARRRAAAAAW